MIDDDGFGPLHGVAEPLSGHRAAAPAVPEGRADGREEWMHDVLAAHAWRIDYEQEDAACSCGRRFAVAFDAIAHVVALLVAAPVVAVPEAGEREGLCAECGHKPHGCWTAPPAVPVGVQPAAEEREAWACGRCGNGTWHPHSLNGGATFRAQCDGCGFSNPLPRDGQERLGEIGDALVPPLDCDRCGGVPTYLTGSGFRLCAADAEDVADARPFDFAPPAVPVDFAEAKSVGVQPEPAEGVALRAEWSSDDQRRVTEWYEARNAEASGPAVPVVHPEPGDRPMPEAVQLLIDTLQWAPNDEGRPMGWAASEALVAAAVAAVLADTAAKIEAERTYGSGEWSDGYNAGIEVAAALVRAEVSGKGDDHA